MKDRPVAETSTREANNTHKRKSCPRWDLKPPSQQVSGRRPMPQAAQPPVSAYVRTISNKRKAVQNCVAFKNISDFSVNRRFDSNKTDAYN